MKVCIWYFLSSPLFPNWVAEYIVNFLGMLYRRPGTNRMDEIYLTASATDELQCAPFSWRSFICPFQATSMGLFRRACRAIGERQTRDGYRRKSWNREDPYARYHTIQSLQCTMENAISRKWFCLQPLLLLWSCRSAYIDARLLHRLWPWFRSIQMASGKELISNNWTLIL